ncbi:MAG: hypothetical protein UW70_C0099G0003 [Candidatus Peregrinibacteria bacterium GW2011_GWA2_44_7]|nr:MAG: hypothetical protein UW70_C0099G0003 [Candidatus Peregrinibacteria bacterium GW2011_GWA2_44_7]
MAGMTKPQKKSFAEMLRGLFVGGEPILRHMAQSSSKTVKKQAEKYSHHLVRRKILTHLAKEFDGKGIYVFDRGNDDKAFFTFLRHESNVQFIARLKSNRLVVLKETGVIMKVGDIPQGKYEVFLMNRHNTAVDTRATFTLVIQHHLEGKQPIRLLAYLRDEFSSEQIVEMYLQRWGVENMYKRAKQKFKLENIRVLNHQKFVNLVSLIQFAVNVSTMAFFAIQKLTHALISGVYFCYQKFLKQKSLGSNIDSFITFLQSSLKPLTFHSLNPPNLQLSLLSIRSLQKLGSF